MIHLNILSSKEKKLYRQAILERLVNYYISIILVTIVFLAFVFVGARLFLIWRVDAFQESIMSQGSGEVAEEIKELEGKIKQANDTLVFVKNTNKRSIGFVSILDNLSSIASSGIHIESLSYKSPGEGDLSEFVLAGKADKREDFLSFLGKLEQSSYFKNIDSPLSNLVKKEDLNFRLVFEME